MSNQFPLKWNKYFNEPEIDQHIFCGIRVTYNPDTDRFHVAKPDKDYPDEWQTVGTFANNSKGYENAIQRMKSEAKHG